GCGVGGPSAAAPRPSRDVLELEGGFEIRTARRRPSALGLGGCGAGGSSAAAPRPSRDVLELEGGFEIRTARRRPPLSGLGRMWRWWSLRCGTAPQPGRAGGGFETRRCSTAPLHSGLGDVALVVPP